MSLGSNAEIQGEFRRDGEKRTTSKYLHQRWMERCCECIYTKPSLNSSSGASDAHRVSPRTKVTRGEEISRRELLLSRFCTTTLRRVVVFVVDDGLKGVRFPRRLWSRAFAFPHPRLLSLVVNLHGVPLKLRYFSLWRVIYNIRQKLITSMT